MANYRLAIYLILAGVFAGCNENPEYLHKWSTVTHRDPLRVDMKQIRRPVVEETFLAPDPGLQGKKYPTGYHYDKLDILVVMDNSPSTGTIQRKLSTQLTPLISNVDDVDWQVAVVTTDNSDGIRAGDPNPCPRNIIRKTDIDREARFQAAISVGEQGDTNEQGILMAVRGLRGENCSPWIRRGSAIAVLIVTDEDNCSFAGIGSECRGTQWETADYLLNELTSMGRILNRSARVYGILGQADINAACPSGELDQGSPGTVYMDAVARSGGMWDSICPLTYAPILERFSKDISKLLGAVEIEGNPLWDTLRFYVNDTPWTGRVEVQNGRARFIDPLPDDSEIAYSFVPVAGASFKLSKPYGGSLQLAQDGLSLTSPSYNFVEPTLTINMPGPFRGGEKIKVNYIENVPLLTRFPIGQVPNKDLVRCWVNDQELAKDAFEIQDETGELLMKDETPSEDAAIRCDV